MWQTILESVLITVITAAISAGVGILVDYLKKKAKQAKEQTDNALVQSLVDIGCSLITDLVNATTQSVVSDLKKGGLFTKEKAEEVFNNVKTTAKETLSSDMIAAIEKTYSMGIDAFLDMKIESVIEESK